MFSFSFLFRNNGIREHLDENDIRRCDGFFFESVIPKVLHYSYVQRSSTKITRHLDKGIERNPITEDFTDMNQHSCGVCTKTFDLLLSASFSRKKTYFLNLT